MTKIKFCGMMREEDIDAANETMTCLSRAGAPSHQMPDPIDAYVGFVGFVFAARSRRRVGREMAARLRARLAPEIAAVGVFTDEDPGKTASLVRDGIIDIVQLHGSEDDGYIADLRELTDAPIIRAFKVREDPAGSFFDAARASTADMVLFDSGAGSGERFDWRLLEGFDRPFFLAGGLAPDNAAEAMRLARPYALDVSSGIETDGKKDPKKMRAFVEAIYGGSERA